jgi:predicted helicase
MVSYIVRSVDEILKSDFGCPQGLADQTEITIKNLDPSLRVKGKTGQVRKTTQSHKVLVLDPAIGTGTFLYGVIDHIRQQFIDTNNAGMWRGYVSKHLLPRLFGFQFMVAPYAVAHFKLSLQLMAHDLPPAMRAQWAYQPQEGERISVYLTNTLDEAHPGSPMPLFTQYVAHNNEDRAVQLHFIGGVAFIGQSPVLRPLRQPRQMDGRSPTRPCGWHRCSELLRGRRCTAR